MKDIATRLVLSITRPPLPFVFVLSLFLLGCVWFVSDISRAASLDRFFLYYVDDIFRYCHIKSLAHNPILAINFFLKPGYALMAGFFYYILPWGMSSLRVMNVFCAAGTLFFVFKITEHLSHSKAAAYGAMVLAVTSPLFFLLSLSTLSEVMYTFLLAAAFYALCQGRYGLSLSVIAFLPLVRQEGLWYLLLWLGICFRHVRPRYLVLVFLPTALWLLLNATLLGHSMSKLVFYLPTKDPPNSMASPGQLLRNLMTIFVPHPSFILCAIGLAVTWKNAAYRFLRICLLGQVFFFAVFQCAHFFDAQGMLCRELRILLPLVPFMAIFGGSALLTLPVARRFGKKLFVCGVVASIGIAAFQIAGLQRDPFVRRDTLRAADEKRLQGACAWLNGYLKEQEITSVCVIPGGAVTDAVIRRVWMYLPGSVNFYAGAGEESVSGRIDNEVFDLATLQATRMPRAAKYIIISREKLGRESFAAAMRVELIRADAALPVYFYLAAYDA